jgi:hypothetical protein
MITESDLPPVDRHLDNAEMLAIGREFDMRPPAGEEVEEACELATRLMAHKVVSSEKVREVQLVQPAATLVFKEDGRVTGLSGQLMMRENAIRPLFDGRFDAVDIDVEFLCCDGELIALGYGWGIAASTKTAGRAIAAFGQSIKARVYDEIPTLTRAVTPVGRHVAQTRYGYVPLRHPDDDLLIMLPSRASERRAA